MDHRLIEGLMEVIAPLIKSYVDERIAKDIAPLHAKIAEYQAVAPEKGEPGLPGKEVDPAEVAVLVAVEVAKAIEGIEKPADGKSVTVEDVKPLLDEMVAALPKAQNGKDADPVDHAEVAKLLVDLMPVPKDGKDGADGKSVDIVDLLPVIEAEVGSVVALIERPKDGQDGKSITVDDVRPLLEEMVAAIEPAKDGKDADPAEVAALIIHDVAKMIPPPADGESVTVEDVLPFLEEMVEKRVSAIPKAIDGKHGKDGVDLVDLLIDREGSLVATFSNGTTKTLGNVVGRNAELGEVERLITDRVSSIPAPEMDKAAVEKFVADEINRISLKSTDEFAPDEVARNIAVVVKMMAEMPQTKQQPEMQPINVYSDVRMPEMKFPETVVHLTVPEQAAPVVNMAAPVVNVAPANVELPKRGKEVTTVTSWDKDGRIKTFEKQEVDDR